MDVEAYGRGWGVKVRASFAYSNQFKMNENEVVLRA